VGGEDRHQLLGFERGDFLKNIEPVLVAQPQVEKDQIEILLLDPAQGEGAVFGGLHVMPLGLQGEGGG